ncbi:MAG: hypothetical protein C4581_06245 [Nitrospiraceae bacterium]|nr:MAG: hypothetical protein C4581_06245 [Nitrospiraceae bacterium]
MMIMGADSQFIDYNQSIADRYLHGNLQKQIYRFMIVMFVRLKTIVIPENNTNGPVFYYDHYEI